MRARGWLLSLMLMSALAVGFAAARPQSEIDRDALAEAGTSGDIVLAERQGDGSRVEAIDAATGEVRLLRQEKNAWLYWPTWSSDARAFAITRIEKNLCDIEIIGRTGQTSRRIPVDAWPWLAWRPHHDQLAVAGSLHNGESGIHLLDLRHKTWRRLTDGLQEQWVAWSASGDMLAFSRVRPGKTVHVLDMATGQQRSLCPGVLAVWAPRGHTLAVIGPNRDRIDLVDADSGTFRPLVTDISCGRLAWSPDGRWLLTDEVRPGRQALLLVDVDGGECRAIGRPLNLLHGFSWGPLKGIEAAGDPRAAW